MSRLDVFPVEHRRDWRDFFRLPKILYRHDPIHVPELAALVRDELDAGKNPVYRFCQAQPFLARRGNEVAARAVAIVNPKLDEELGVPAGLLGYFESVDDLDVAAALFERCQTWCAARGARWVLANVHFSFNYQVGILTSGFEAPHTFLMPHHPTYYRRLFEQSGFHTVKRLHAYRIDLAANPGVPLAVAKRAAQLKEEGFHVRRMRPADVFPCLVDYNQTWSGNFGHTPFTDEELKHTLRSMRLFMDLEFCFIAEKDGRLAGYLLTLPDFNCRIRKWQGKLGLPQLLDFLWTYKVRRKVVGLKTLIIGVTAPFHGRQVSAVLNSALMERAAHHDCRYIERSWILEDNIPSIKQATRVGGTLYKIYDVFGRTSREASDASAGLGSDRL